MISPGSLGGVFPSFSLRLIEQLSFRRNRCHDNGEQAQDNAMEDALNSLVRNDGQFARFAWSHRILSPVEHPYYRDDKVEVSPRTNLTDSVSLDPAVACSSLPSSYTPYYTRHAGLSPVVDGLVPA